MFASRARANPCEAPIGQAPSLAHKHETKLEKPGRNRPSSLIAPFVSYTENKGCEYGPCGLYYKHVTIVNYASSDVNKLKASLNDDARVVIYDRHMFIVQAPVENCRKLIDLAGLKIHPLFWLKISWPLHI